MQHLDQNQNLDKTEPVFPVWVFIGTIIIIIFIPMCVCVRVCVSPCFIEHLYFSASEPPTPTICPLTPDPIPTPFFAFKAKGAGLQNL